MTALPADSRRTARARRVRAFPRSKQHKVEREPPGAGPGRRRVRPFLGIRGQLSIRFRQVWRAYVSAPDDRVKHLGVSGPGPPDPSIVAWHAAARAPPSNRPVRPARARPAARGRGDQATPPHPAQQTAAQPGRPAEPGRPAKPTRIHPLPRSGDSSRRGLRRRSTTAATWRPRSTPTSTRPSPLFASRRSSARNRCSGPQGPARCARRLRAPSGWNHQSSGPGPCCLPRGRRRSACSARPPWTAPRACPLRGRRRSGARRPGQRWPRWPVRGTPGSG
jgi:hypothetical protein